MRKSWKPYAAALAVFLVLACAALLPYQAMRASDAKRLKAPVTRPVGTGQPKETLLQNQLVLALYRRGQALRSGTDSARYFTPDETRSAPNWEATLAQLREAAFLPTAFQSILQYEPELSSASWDKADFWQLAGQADHGVAGWYIVAEPQSGKAVSVSVHVDGTCEAPDLEGCLDAWRTYMGLDGLPGWRREQASGSGLTIYTDTCPDAQIMLTAAWEATDTWSSFNLSANAQVNSTIEEDIS